jgi:BirA family biotin operon repressor/biotin-[acetyl-CoA-carboxylase] ligase
MHAPRAPLDKSVITAEISQYWRVSVVDLTGSTQSDLAELVNASVAQPGDVIATEFQSAGRGRLDRSFDAPNMSALLFSFYVRSIRDKSEWGFISFIAAISMHEVISKILNLHASLKWPNDILIEEKKVAGLLAQQVNDGVIIGLGLNVEMSAEELPVSSATSLEICEASLLDRNLLLAQFLNQFEKNFKQWESGIDFIPRYMAISSTLGQEVRVEIPGRDPFISRALSLKPTGALILSDGFEVNVGDIIHLR